MRLPSSIVVSLLRKLYIQVQYLGYPGTMGAEFIDYVIGDSIVTPQLPSQRPATGDRDYSNLNALTRLGHNLLLLPKDLSILRVLR